MYNFILQTAVILSLGVMIYLVARVRARVEILPETNERKDYVDKIMNKLPLARIDAALHTFFGKTLRKFKVLVMKVDNLTNIYINKLKKNDPTKNSENRGDIREMFKDQAEINDDKIDNS
ncbi:MAG: hypothetical protein Q8Q37_02250 [bacterium]|nr:hypothetical protein [bacterium]